MGCHDHKRPEFGFGRKVATFEEARRIVRAYRGVAISDDGGRA